MKSKKSKRKNRRRIIEELRDLAIKMEEIKKATVAVRIEFGMEVSKKKGASGC